MNDQPKYRGPGDLPDRIPIFPLSGAILLPRCRLPLNIFEPRYLNMIDDALAGDRIIGMVQPIGRRSDDAAPATYSIGCAGRIAQFSETDDGRYLITLVGVSRFDVKSEPPAQKPYRIAQCDWRRFQDDFAACDAEEVDRASLMGALRRYLNAERLDADWPSIERAKPEALVNSLAMICPFEPDEKQALLEAPRLKDRAEALTALMRITTAERSDDDGPEFLQ